MIVDLKRSFSPQLFATHRGARPPAETLKPFSLHNIPPRQAGCGRHRCKWLSGSRFGTSALGALISHCAWGGACMELQGHTAIKYVTGEPLETSSGRGWSNVLAERWNHEAGALPSLIPRETEVAVLLSGRSLVYRE